jgi:hypothetical protein
MGWLRANNASEKFSRLGTFKYEENFVFLFFISVGTYVTGGFSRRRKKRFYGE